MVHSASLSESFILKVVFTESANPLTFILQNNPPHGPHSANQPTPKPASFNALASLKSIIATDRQTKQFQTIKMTAESIRDFVNIIVKMLNSHSNLVISQKIL